MPNRILKESICESERLARLSDFAFRLWIGLIVCADDAGRGDARPAIIRGRVFPLRERVTSREISTALGALERSGCICLYTVEGRPYYRFPSWSRHQRIRDVRPKYPAPGDDAPPCAADAAGPPQSAADGRTPPPESNPIQSEQKSGSESDARARAFDAFWAAYPRKVGKEAARRAFARLGEEIWPRLVPAVEAHRHSEQWTKDDGRFIPHPATWLNRGQWEDETDVHTTAEAGPFKLEAIEL